MNRKPCRYCGAIHASQQCPAFGKTYARCRKTGHYKKVCRSRKQHEVHEIDVEVAHESQDEQTEIVSIDSVCLNGNHSVITASLDTFAGENKVEIPYKIYTGREGNIMPFHIFKKIFQNMTVEQLKQSIKNHIRLCTYNGTNIMQLRSCTVFIKFKNIKKCSVFFVVPGNGQALIGMPDVDSLDIIKINIDSIQVERSECKANNMQEMQTNADSCTNMRRSAINKEDTNIQRQQDTSINTINYFVSSSNTDADKRKSSDDADNT